MDAAGAPEPVVPYPAEPEPVPFPEPAVAPEASSDRAPDGLSEREQRILAFERQWWKHAGAKEQAVRERFDISSTRYYQLLNKIIDKQEALAYDPMLVKRLRRLRTSRARARSARRLGIDLR
jgi:hypothetical protein